MRAVLILNGPINRDRAIAWVRRAPNGTQLQFKHSGRTLEQNACLWAKLTDVSEQVVWYGRQLSAEDWKDIFTASLRKARVVPGIEAGSFVVLGMHTSDMTRDEFSNLLALIDAFAAEHGVDYHEPPEKPIRGVKT